MAEEMLKRIPAKAWGKYLKEWRLNMGYTQTEIGVLLGVDQTTISRWELGLAVNTVIIAVHPDSILAREEQEIAG